VGKVGVGTQFIAASPAERQQACTTNRFVPLMEQIKPSWRLNSQRCNLLQKNSQSFSPVAQGKSIRLLIENYKSNNSFLWRQLTASGIIPKRSFLVPHDVPNCLVLPLGGGHFKQ